MKSLAFGIALYKEDTGSYPSKIEDIQNDKLNPDINWSDLNSARNNRWNDVYSYKITTNGITITAVGPECGLFGWFKQPRVRTESFDSDGKNL